MRVTSIIENTSNKGLPVEHGLSLYIENSASHPMQLNYGGKDKVIPWDKLEELFKGNL